MKKMFCLTMALLFLLSCKEQEIKNDLEANFLFAQQQLTLAQQQTDSIAKLRNAADTSKVVVSPRSIDYQTIEEFNNEYFKQNINNVV